METVLEVSYEFDDIETSLFEAEIITCMYIQNNIKVKDRKLNISEGSYYVVFKLIKDETT